MGDGDSNDWDPTQIYDTVSNLVPVAGTVMKDAEAILQFIGYWTDPDPLSEAVQYLQGEINQLVSDVDGLISQVNQLEQRIATDENLQRLNRLSDLSRQLASLNNQLSQAPTDANVRDQIVFDAAGVADVFLNEPDIWNWTDVLITPSKDGGGNPVQNVTALPPDFKAYPGLPVYAYAITTWLTALDLDTNGGNFEAVQAKYGAQLQRHSVAAAQTLPENIQKRLSCSPIPHTKYAVDQKCIFAIQCDNAMLRNRTIVADNLAVVMNDPGPEVFCTTSPDIATPAFLQAAQDNGVSILDLLETMLQKVQTTGSLRDPFIGTFDQTPVVQPAWLYAVVPGGNLIWHKIEPAASPQSLSKILGPTTVGSGWNEFKAIFPAGGNRFYGLLPTGVLRWYQHDGFNDGAFLWTGPEDVGIGWQNFLYIVPASDGVVYAVQPDGTLLWYRHDGYQAGGGAKTWRGPVTLTGGWNKYRTIFSVGQGTLYGVESDGSLIWQMHLGWQTGENKWALTAPNRWGAPVNTPVQIGTGWQNFRDIFGTTDGTIFAVTPEGTLLMYQHKGFETGADSWTGPVNAGTGWKSYLQAFTIMPENIPDAPH